MVSINIRNLHSILIEDLVYFLLILIISNTAQVCFNPMTKLTVVALLMVLYAYKRRNMDFILVGLFIYWIFLNAIYSIVFSEIFVFSKAIGYTINLFVAYFAMKIIGNTFWSKLERWIYVLTCISLVLYVGNLILPTLYDSLSSVFGRFAGDFYKDARPSTWYAFVYTYVPPDIFSYTRNSGFMWEPGAFAMVSIFGFIYSFCKNNMKLNRRCYIYIIAILTTFSTSGYLAIGLFFLYYFASRKNVLYFFILLIFVLVLMPIIYHLEFLSEKIMAYTEEANTRISFYNARLDMQEYNRFTVFEINMKRLIGWPLGYGMFSIKDDYGMEFVGVNGLAVFARMWGVFGLGLLLYSLKKVFGFFNSNINTIVIFVFALMALIMFFSNPVDNSVFLWFFILTPFIYKRNIIL